MNNFEIRSEIAASRLKRYEIAMQMGIRETSFSRMFRTELTPMQVERIRRAIEDLLKKEVYHAKNAHA